MAPVRLPDPAHHGPDRQERESHLDGKLENQEDLGHG